MPALFSLSLNQIVMKIVGKDQVINDCPLNRENVTIKTTGIAADDFILDNELAFFISVAADCKLRVRTVGGQIGTFDFLKGEDVGLYDKIYSHADNSIATISVRY